jgi:hypothetical protein
MNHSLMHSNVVYLEWRRMYFKKLFLHRCVTGACSTIKITIGICTKLPFGLPPSVYMTSCAIRYITTCGSYFKDSSARIAPPVLVVRKSCHRYPVPCLHMDSIHLLYSNDAKQYNFRTEYFKNSAVPLCPTRMVMPYKLPSVAWIRLPFGSAPSVLPCKLRNTVYTPRFSYFENSTPPLVPPMLCRFHKNYHCSLYQASFRDTSLCIVEGM